MNLIDIFQEQVHQKPDRIALIDHSYWRERQTSFTQLEELSARTAQYFWQLGLRPGDHVLVFQPMSLELYVILLALFRSGMVAMFIDPGMGLDHIENCCHRIAPRAWIGTAKAWPFLFLSKALRRIPIKITSDVFLPGSHHLGHSRNKGVRSALFPAQADFPALLTFTSGSTGLPKAIIRTHGFLLSQHAILQKHLQLQSGQIDLATMPIVLLANLASGVTSLIPNTNISRPGKVNAKVLCQQIVRHKIDRSVASPAFFDRMANHAIKNHIQLSSLGQLYTGGAPVFPRLLTQMQQFAPHAKVVALYGSTEAEPIAHIEASEISPTDRRIMTQGGGLLTGQPVPEIDLRIIQDQFGVPLPEMSIHELNAITLPPDQVGEIIVSGNHVIAGYVQGHGDADTKIKVGGKTWHRTGDAGYLDQQGRLWLLGRCQARLPFHGGFQYPFAIEAAATEIEGIHRCALVHHNNRRVLVVEWVRRSRNWKQLEQLLEWAQLDRFLETKSLPVDKRHNAKVNYPALRKWLNSRRD